MDRQFGKSTKTIIMKRRFDNKAMYKRNEWEEIRAQGMKKYVFYKTITMGIMMFFIYAINIFINKNMNYSMTAVVYIGISLLAPIVSWFGNEFRYNKSQNEK